MAKKKQQLYKFMFDGDTPVEHTVSVQSVGRGAGAPNFFFRGNRSPGIVIHTELTWLTGLAQTGKVECVIDRSVEDKRSIIVYNNEQSVIATIELEDYYVIKGTEEEVFFELRQKPSGGWTLTHSMGLLQADLSKVRAFILEAI